MIKDNLLSGLKQKGFSEEIINAFAKVRREDFVPENLAPYSYEDIPLPIEVGSTISQPSTVAFMLNLLELKQGQKILEIGSGSGYTLALMSEIIKDGKIYGIELLERLAIKSKNLLAKDSNIEVINRSGLQGLPEFAPYDRILVSASCPNKDSLAPFLEQLKDLGILVAAVHQSIFQIKKENSVLTEKEFPGFVFVPLVKENKESKESLPS